MSPSQPLISRVAADVLTGYYKRKRMTQDELAARAEIPLPTLQKKLKGNAPITATDLVMLSQAIGIDPAKVMGEIVEEAAAQGRQTPEGVASITDHRRKKALSEMTDDELEGLRHAAKFNEELEQDQPDGP